MANTSAQETTPGQAFSTADLMLSMTSNPRAELRLGTAFFSPVKEDVSSSRTDPSHPCRENAKYFKTTVPVPPKAIERQTS